MIEQTLTSAPQLKRRRLCAALAVSHASHYRRRKAPARPVAQSAGQEQATPEQPAVAAPTAVAKAHPRALGAAEKQQILETLNDTPYQDLAVPQVYARLLDEGRYLGSPRTLYRVLAEHEQVRERRDQRVHPPHAVPRLRADGPNQVWSWDITKIRCQEVGLLFLYVVIDIFSRFIVGWTLQRKESGELARQLIGQACLAQAVEPGQLIVHSDRGGPMISLTLGELFTELGIHPSLSRPRVSNDNPYSESQFKTLKYRPEYPGVFATEAQAHQTIKELLAWYQTEHLHSGIGYLTPHAVHTGQAGPIIAQREQVLQAAFAAHPERFVNGPPKPPTLPKEVFINRPQPAPPPALNIDAEQGRMEA